MEYICWYQRTCKRQGEICNNLKDCSNCTRYLQMKLQTEMANIPMEFPIEHRLDTSKKDLQAYTDLKALDIQDFVVKGKSLVIQSKFTGNGKSTWAKKLLLRYMAKKVGRINTGYFINLPQALAEAKDSLTTRKELPYQNIFSTVRLLVVDEVGVKKLTDFEENWLLRMVTEREKRPGLATIYTLNLPDSGDLKEILGKRLYSRIIVKSQIITFVEGDKRAWPKE